ncbi:hypothetical protein C1S82_26825 [Mycolicibacterium cosmeticum]|nr:hypothetical protein C1S82_26825 [Mycolicibacterium cosmeticum]
MRFAHILSHRLIQLVGDSGEVIIKEVSVDARHHRRLRVPNIRCTTFTLTRVKIANDAAV